MTEPTAVAVADLHVDPAPSHLNPDRAAAYDRFCEVIEHLQTHGWVRGRVDTLVRRGEEDTRNRWTVRQQYSAGTWELHFERDCYAGQQGDPWARAQYEDSRRTLRLTLGRDLPDLDQALDQLFGEYRPEFVGLCANCG